MIKMLYAKYKDLIPYAFFGVCTTLVNLAAYWFFAHLLGLAVVPATVLAWGSAVLFAYLTNRKWVFHSEARTRGEIVRELAAFYACRIATGVVDWAGMYGFVELLGWNDLLMKIVLNLLVIILNYAASRLVIFKKRKSD